MFWIAIAALSFAFMFTKLGALSVLVSVLSNALAVMLVVVICFVVALLWRKLSKDKSLKLTRQ